MLAPIKVCNEGADARWAADDGDELEAVLVGAAPDRDPARPRHRINGGERLVRRHAVPQLRQVEERRHSGGP